MDSLIKEAAAPIDSLYLALLQCFGIILCGYVAGRLEVITRSEANGLNTFVGTFALPSLIFLSMAKLDFTTVNWRFLLAVLFAKSVVFFVVLIVSIVSTKPYNFGRSALFAIFTTQSNDFAIGYPMINALYGSTHPEYSLYLYLMAPISLVALNPIGFVFLEVAKRQQGDENRPRGNNTQMLKEIIKGIVTNPVLFMTLLGIIGNILFNHKLPPVIQVVLEVFGNAFSATALFLLGLMMVGKVHKLKGVALVIPGILISIKLLVLPLIIRESVVFLNAGQNTTETSDLSTFGFLYGTIPTAPALFIFTLRYNIDIDLIASAMVVCTFLSAPLMFISAKLIDAIGNGVTPSDYAKDLKSFSFDTSAASVAACLWLLICFLGIRRKRLRSITHRCTFSLVLAQLITGIGVLIWTKLDNGSVGTLIWYIQFSLITIGIYASRLWTGAIGLTLLFLSSQSVTFVENLEKWFCIVCWGVPFVVISVICFTVNPTIPSDDDLRNPNFQFGRVHAAVTIVLLIFCFVVTIGSLVLRQRYQRRSLTSTLYSSSSTSVLAESNTTTVITRNVVDVEDLLSPIANAPNNTSSINIGNSCSTTGLCCTDDVDCSTDCDSDNENEGTTVSDHQTLRHLVLLILLLCSMFIGLAMTLAILVMEEMTGIFTELAFVDVALSFGQSLVAFAIFGVDSGFGKLGCWLTHLLAKWRMEKELQLPDEDSLSPESKAIREQFKRCYLAKCQARIAACRRHLLRTYNGVFTGSELVNWLLEAGVAKDREEAIYYCRCLLDSRVLNHIDGTQHFHDRNLLYTFRA
ncbi:integral membrane protein GPR155 [Copidosoma floridanum]|uniref:integral membrane protein GPR155 n=1 Tax=Copidosoma floridanum TaxID=29053 RepID=UPI0006C93CFD|nr:integral membrane protein GPR155 [Copidosoma floridanum]XP_014216839.1 integral membrane protein GPR155 [Copidosoma floridanum]XP_014216840.1 integral membrane protein GPR155 [Copidosoma floridanum]